MLIHAAEPLFARGQLEGCPTLATIRELLSTVPDRELLEGLIAARGHGRDDYPVARLRHVVPLTILLRHTSFRACLGELHRNPALGRLIGITAEDQIPNGWDRSRSLDTLGQEPHLSALRQVFDALARPLGHAVPDLGRHTAGEATALSARAKTDPKAATQEIRAGLPQPTGGRKEYTDAEGEVVKVVEWFGYQLHLLVDVRHEAALAYHITDTTAGDNERIEALVEQAEADLPARRIETLAHDKAADDAGVHEVLHEHGIKPAIQNRALWREEPERPLPGGRAPQQVVHDEAGTVSCYGTVSDPPVRRRMACAGYEEDRGTIKDRGTRAGRAPARRSAMRGGRTGCRCGCPANRTCGGSRRSRVRRSSSNGCTGAGRRWSGSTRGCRSSGAPPTATSWGARRFAASVGAVMVVPLVFATLRAKAPRWEGTLGQTRLGPVAQALREPPAT
jgi:Transposase DDE domain